MRGNSDSGRHKVAPRARQNARGRDALDPSVPVDARHAALAFMDALNDILRSERV